MTQTADEKEEALGELEAVIGEEPAIAPLLDTEVQLSPAEIPDDPRPATSTPTPNDTRERILDVALELFTDQGYDGTSLRQIAEQLGVTKAALYYHFESKEDILLALHMRLHEFSKGAMGLIGDGPVSLAQWGELLDDMVDQMLAQRKIFLMHERNQAALEKLHAKDHEAEHEDIQNQLRRVLADDRVLLRDRVRMAASIGVLFSGLFLAGDAFEASSTQELGDELRAVLHDVVQG